jgi:hypothetical protein
MNAEEEKEFIYVKKSVADKYKKATDENAQMEIITNLISSAKRSMQDDLEALDEDAIRFKGILLAYKKRYGEVLSEHCASTLKLWEDIQDKIPNTKKMAENLVKEFEAVERPLDDILSKMKMISEGIKNINTYELEKMVNLVNTIQAQTKKLVMY